MRISKKNIWWLSLLTGFLIYAGLIEPYYIVVKVHDLTISGFPDEPICMVHIADTHTTGLGLRERRLVKIVDEIVPDYVFITGDLLKGHSSLSDGLSFTSMLRARKSIVAVCGNADTAIHAARRAGTLWEDTPHLKVLFNESMDCGDFWLVGLDDPVTHRARPKHALSKVDGTRPVIVLTHFHPDYILDELRKAGVDLVLSAHTHGGQVGFPALVRLIPYASRSKYVSGLYDLGDFRLNVSRGIGTNIFPFRFLCRPQVDVFYIRGTGE
jgi:hypothetical protein